jgi:hypothetical protein
VNLFRYPENIDTSKNRALRPVQINGERCRGHSSMIY